MRSLLLLLAGLVPVAAATRPAAADPHADYFAGLIAELNDRDAALPETGLTSQQKRERAALRKCFAALRADSTDLKGDLKMARKMAAALAVGYPGDGTLAGLLDGLNDALGNDVHSARDDLEVAIATVADGRPKDRAQAKLDAADVLLAEADAETEAAPRALLQKRAYALVDKGARIVAKADPGGPSGDSTMGATVDGDAWAANDQFGTAVSGFAEVSEAFGGVRRIVVVGRRILPDAGDPPLPGDETRIRLSLASSNDDITTGDFPVNFNGGVSASATWAFEPESGGVSNAVAISGTISITSLNAGTASVDVSGTFTLTMYDGIADTTFEITGGTFEAFDLPRYDVE
jgi:hypothetical protein